MNKEEKQNCLRWAENLARERFGEEAFIKFMDANNLKYLIRAHEAFPEGYRWFFDKKLLSIFSAANYRGPFSNPASYAVIRKNSIIPKTIELS